MTSRQIKNSFIKRFEEDFYLRIRNYINSFLKLDTNNITSLGLFLQLPINISLTKVQTLPIKEFADKKFNLDLIKFLQYFSAYTIVQKENEKVEFAVHFSFLYQNEQDLETLLENLNLEIIRKFLSFAYLHELQHILRRHTTKTTISIYDGVVQNYIRKYKKQNIDTDLLINSAFDYAINYPLIELVYDKEFQNIIKSISLYNKSYHSRQMSEITILEDLLSKIDEIEMESQKSKGKDGRKNEEIETSTITIKSKDGEEQKLTSHKLTKHQTPNENIEDMQEMEREAVNIANSIAKFIEEKQKGDYSQSTLSKLGSVIKVKSDWVKELLNQIYIITRDITHQYISTWGSLKNQYRKIGLFPNKKFLKKMTFIYVSIDQSGSMSDVELRKINYILIQIAKKVNYLNILIHDIEISRIFQFGSKGENRDKKIDLTEFIQNRYTHGGTSHEAIFQYLDENLKKKDISQSIYISFSDNQSDIEECYYKYKTIQKIRKFWITTDRDINVSGRKISMR